MNMLAKSLVNILVWSLLNMSEFVKAFHRKICLILLFAKMNKSEIFAEALQGVKYLQGFSKSLQCFTCRHFELIVNTDYVG